jgi:ubiquinone biosynthesis protein
VLFEDLGGTYIKFGQMLALQPDILTLEYCNELFDLLDKITPVDYDQVEALIVEELGRPPAELFDSFDSQPLASASIGQVHVAYLDGQKLAVKVQRPGVERDFVGDIQIMTGAIQLIRRLRLKRLYWAIEPISEFAAWTREEMDYLCEARYMEQLRSNAGDRPLERVPYVLRDYTTSRVLVCEFLEGMTLLDHLRDLEANNQTGVDTLKSNGFTADQFARNIIDNFLGDAFKHGLFHADLHPANLMILPGNVVGYVDFGITCVLSHYSRRELVSLTLAYTRADIDGMCASFFKISALDANSDPEQFRQGLLKFADEWYERQGDQWRLRRNFTLVMLDMLRLSRRTGVWPERDVVKYIRSSIAIDGLVTRFAPGFDVGKYLGATCERHLKSQIRQSMFTYNALMELFDSSFNLMRDGSYRAFQALQRVTGSESTGDGRVATGNSGELRHRAAYLAIIVLVVSALAMAAGQPVRFGINLFTAEAVLVVFSTAKLLQTIYRLVDTEAPA